MNLWESLALVGTASTILGVFLTIYGVVNNKTLKHETKLTRETIAQESKLTRETIAEETKLTREMIKETTEYLGNLIVTEREMIKETTEYLAKYLGDLIVADGNRTRLAMSK
ncbi:MAG: hypothetical protein QME42_05625 [bacterium]|nr:hypothetical protein [bacterium]